MMRRLAYGGVLVLCVFLACMIQPFAALGASATSSAALQQQIDIQNTQINELNNEIAQYQKQLDATAQKSQTLQSTLSQLNLSIKKKTTQISSTQHQINSTQLQIEQLNDSIDIAQQAIATNTAALADSVRTIAEEEAQPLAVQMLADGTVTGVWDDIAATERLQSAVADNIRLLAAAKDGYTSALGKNKSEQDTLVDQKETLKTQQGSLNVTKKTQSDLLAQTKSQESAYQKIIDEKKQQAADIQAALDNLKSQYNQTVNPTSYPPPTPNLFAWPIDGTIRITQYFGDTPFAQANPSVYRGSGHDGLDIAAPIGTPVHAVMAGTVLATGDTDKVDTSLGQCYSFGKWVMLKHADGLNSMYAHLSEIDVSEGQSLKTGDVIGYSGETGYATGPHLHFGVYVSAVTQIIPLGQATNSKTPCATAVMPVPPVSGYLNPLNYLPPLASS